MNELTISLDGTSSVPLYEQIYKYIKSDIQNGGLPFQKKAASTRKLAKYLQVSRTTLDLAYEQLVSGGYIEAIPCRGYFVCNLEGLYRQRQSSHRRHRPGRSRSGICMISRPTGLISTAFRKTHGGSFQRKCFWKRTLLVSAWRPAGGAAAAVQHCRLSAPGTGCRG